MLVTEIDQDKPNAITKLYDKTQERSKSFFKLFEGDDKMSTEDSTNYISMFRKNESLFVTIVNEKGTVDNIIGGIQFKMSGGGIWINYFGVLDGDVKKSVFGSIAEHFDKENNFRRNGIGLILIQLVQLYACCKGTCPNVHIRVSNDSAFYRYLLNRGFVLATTTPAYKYFVDNLDDHTSIRSKLGQNFVVLSLTDIAHHHAVDNKWKRPIYNSSMYHYSQTIMQRSNWPPKYLLFQSPIQVNGWFLDQCAYGLMFLGLPFFYCQDTKRILSSTVNDNRLQKVTAYGNLIQMIDRPILGHSKNWLKSDHLQILINWILRDDANPILKQYHVVPMDISAAIRTFFDGSGHGNLIGITKLLDSYAARNWQCLECNMIFYIQNIKNEHWILEVAVNPCHMITRVMGVEFGNSVDDVLYGYMYVDSMETIQRNGSMHSDGTDNPTANRELIFLLNYLSRYRDRSIYNLTEISTTEDLLKRTMYYGMSGPFGRVFMEDEKDIYNEYISLYPLFYYPQLKCHTASFPIQEDGFNCGIFVLINIIDMICSQWDQRWVFPTNWKALVKLHQSIIIGEDIELGKTFVKDPQSTTGTQYTRICNYIRMELVMLMERLHCIFYNAFSADDSICDDSILGQLRPSYKDNLSIDPLAVYIYNKLHKDIEWPTTKQKDNIAAEMKPIAEFIRASDRAVFPVEHYKMQKVKRTMQNIVEEGEVRKSNMLHKIQVLRNLWPLHHPKIHNQKQKVN